MRAALALLLLTLAACSPEIIYMVPEPEPVAEEATAEVPSWQPEPMHVYVLDAEDTIVTDYTAEDEADYQRAVRAWALTVECHNAIDDPAGLDPWHLVGGGTG